MEDQFGTKTYNCSRVSYSDFIMKGRYPITVIFINCPTDSVDANVHPAKTRLDFKTSIT